MSQKKGLKDTLSENPIPDNISKPRKLDEYYKELLEDQRKRRELALDDTFERLQQKTLSVFGPLSNLWCRIYEAMATVDSEKEIELDISELSQ